MALYYTVKGRVNRIIFGDIINAVIDVTEPAVEVGSTVAFSGLLSSDPDSDALLFEWDFDGDGEVDSFASEDSYTYNDVGLYEARLSVRNVNGGIGRDTVKINVLPPAAGSILDPFDAFELFPWSSGDACPEGYDFCGILEFCQGIDDDEARKPWVRLRFRLLG